MNKTLTRADLAATLYADCSVPLSTAAQLVDAIIDEMVATLETEEALKLSGFGTFKKHRKKERIGDFCITPRKGSIQNQAMR